MIADRLLAEIDKKQTPCIVGLDPTLEMIPEHRVEGDSFKEVADTFTVFNFDIIDAVADLVPAVKPQIAFYERYGTEGIRAFKSTVDYARSKGLVVIEDGKRNDISSTALAYAEAHLGFVKTPSGTEPSFNLDLLTVNPYLGSDGLRPFVDVCREHGKGIFILVKTSNPSSGELQDRLVRMTPHERAGLERLGVIVKDDSTELYNLVALQVDRYAQECKGRRGYSSIGAVVGATYPEQAAVLRKIMPNSFFLVPGYRAQGGTAETAASCFNDDGYGAVINSSRGITAAYKEKGTPEDHAKAARDAAEKMIQDVNAALDAAGRLPKTWKNPLL